MGVIFAFCLRKHARCIAHPLHDVEAMTHPCKILSKPLLNLYAHKSAHAQALQGTVCITPICTAWSTAGLLAGKPCSSNLGCVALSARHV